MDKTTEFSRRQLFNIARAVAGITVKIFCKMIGPEIEPPMIHMCLYGKLKNKKINTAIDNLIGVNISLIADWYESNKSDYPIK